MQLGGAQWQPLAALQLHAVKGLARVPRTRYHPLAQQVVPGNRHQPEPAHNFNMRCQEPLLMESGRFRG